MSKEKNLVIYREPNTSNLAVDAHGHTWSEDHQYFDNGLSVRAGIYISGPAIDRLYEFEKLGMEPEEIEKILRINTENLNYLHDRLTEQTGVVLGLEKENKELRANVDRRDRAIDGQNDYIRELKGKLKQKTEEYGTKITAMAADMDKLEEENKYLSEDKSVQATIIHHNLNTIDKLRSMNQRLEKNVELLQKEYDDAHAAIHNLYKEIDEREQVQLASYREIGKLRHEQILMRDANATMKLQKEKLEAEVSKLEKKIELKDAKLYDKNVMIDKLQKELKEHEENSEYWKGERNDAFDEIRKLRAENRELKIKNHKLCGALGFFE